MLNVARRSGGGTVGLRFTPLLLGAGAGRDARIELGLTYVGRRRALDLLPYFRCAFLGEECRGPTDPDTGTPTLGTTRDYQEDLDPFTKLRVGFSHPISRGSEAFLNIENLTNDQVGEFVTIAPSRGRTVLVGIRFGQ
ncbi:MAG TPA: hypothetical protein VFS05_04635, partial [Gemmatimonadaceae bacterium]|nr:hypothetical protein [Gemmatimonadaceae bacterium]